MRNGSRLIAGALACSALGLAFGINGAIAAEPGPVHDCDGPDFTRRVPACTALIEAPETTPERRATALANRALVYSVRGEYEAAIPDYDAAIQLFPYFAPALNNRAWAYFKWGKLEQADVDADRSLRIDSAAAETFDTRGHVSQWQGNQLVAINAYDMAMVFGGSRMTGVYQCGLKIQKLYSGPIDGNVSVELRTAIRMCVEKGSACDPLPPDDDCGSSS